jgi:hypothetical protein
MTETLHCGTSGPADDPRLSALDRSPILLPDRKEGVSLAHTAQEPKLIPRPLHRWADDSRRLGMRGRRLKLNAAEEKRRTLPTLQRLLGRPAMPSRDQAIPTGTEVDCESLVVGAACRGAAG